MLSGERFFFFFFFFFFGGGGGGGGGLILQQPEGHMYGILLMIGLKWMEIS